MIRDMRLPMKEVRNDTMDLRNPEMRPNCHLRGAYRQPRGQVRKAFAAKELRRQARCARAQKTRRRGASHFPNGAARLSWPCLLMGWKPMPLESMQVFPARTPIRKQGER